MAKGGSSTNTSSVTNQTATNQQVATESGIAIGANSNADINVTTADPTVAKFAIEGNTAAVQSALASNYATSRDAFDLVQDVNRSSIEGVTGTANLAILGSQNMASEFAEHVSEGQARNIAILQDLASQNADTLIRNNAITEKVLDQSFANTPGGSVISQNEQIAGLATTQTKYAIIGVVIIGFIMVLLTFRKK